MTNKLPGRPVPGPAHYRLQAGLGAEPAACKRTRADPQHRMLASEGSAGPRALEAADPAVASTCLPSVRSRPPPPTTQPTRQLLGRSHGEARAAEGLQGAVLSALGHGRQRPPLPTRPRAPAPDPRPASAPPGAAPARLRPASCAAGAPPLPPQAPRPGLQPLHRSTAPQARRHPRARASPQGANCRQRTGTPRSECGRRTSAPAPARAPTPPPVRGALPSPQPRPPRPLRPLSPPRCPRRRSWVRPAALQPNNAPSYRPSPRRAAQQRALRLADLEARRGRGSRGEGEGKGGGPARGRRGPAGTCLGAVPLAPGAQWRVWHKRSAGRQRRDGGSRPHRPRR